MLSICFFSYHLRGMRCSSKILISDAYIQRKPSKKLLGVEEGEVVSQKLVEDTLMKIKSKYKGQFYLRDLERGWSDSNEDGIFVQLTAIRAKFKVADMCYDIERLASMQLLLRLVCSCAMPTVK